MKRSKLERNAAKRVRQGRMSPVGYVRQGRMSPVGYTASELRRLA